MKKYLPSQVKYYLLREKKTLALITVSGLLCNAGMVIAPLFEGLLAQCLLDVFGGSRQASDMLSLALLYIAAIAAEQGIRFVKRFYVRRFGNNINRSLKRILYGNLISKSKPECEKESVGSVMTKAVSDADACSEGIRKVTTEVFDTGVVLVAYSVMLFSYSVPVALSVILFPLATYLFAALMRKKVTESAAESRESAGRMTGETLTLISNAIPYRVFGLEKQRAASYGECLDDYEKKAVRTAVMSNSLKPLYRALALLGLLPAVLLGSRCVTDSVWDIAAFTTFIACYTKLALKSSNAANLFGAAQKASVSWRRIKPMLTESKADMPPAALPSAALTVRNLSFAYPDCEKILQNVSFNATKGQIIGVAGAVASGKTTLGNVFLCEYPYEGSIKLGGTELRDLPYGCVCYMGHDPELISDTVENNIMLGDDGDVRTYLAAVGLDAEVDAMPQKEQTVVGSEGHRLSGGQQSRIALARALAHKKPLTVLDDPFSAVDKDTERVMLDGIRRLASDCVVLIITHRLYLFESFDSCIWLDKGVSVSGTSDALCESVPEYKSLLKAFTRNGGDER